MARYLLDGRPAGKTALVVASAAADEVWQFGDVERAVRRAARGFLGAGLAPGTRVMIRLENEALYAIAFFGAVAAGLVALPSSAMLTPGEASFLLMDSEASALVVADGLEMGEAVPAGVKIITRADVAAWIADGPLAPWADTAADDPAFLIYTSGTTSRPKGVLHAQRSAWGRRPMHAGWHGIRENDVVLHAGAFNWTYTLGVGLTDPWAVGATAILYVGPKDPAVWPRLIERHRATVFATVPSLYRQILKYGALDAHDLSSLRHGLSAGEALSPALLEAWRGATGKELYEALGMSELSTPIGQPAGEPVRPGRSGRPQPGRRIAILPIDGGAEPLPPGHVGLLAMHRSDPGLMLGYWKRPEEDAQVLRGEWFVGGDLAEMDADGYISYHGRNDDVMNAMGYRVSPLEVEGALAGHPAVAEVAVTELAVTPEINVIAAFVVPRDPDEADAAGILEWAAARLAPYKRPREVIFVDVLPRTANGKVMRKALRNRVRA
jgi:acyl-coenzyme A synthetase/AMP-(fatty) acid ligase